MNKTANFSRKTNGHRSRRRIAAAVVAGTLVMVPVLGASATAVAAPQGQYSQVQPGQGDDRDPGGQNRGGQQSGPDDRGRDQPGRDQPGQDRRGRYGYTVPNGYNDNLSAPQWPGGGEPPSWWWQALHLFGLA